MIHLPTTRRRGHTLGELLVVLFILSLFAFVAIPKFMGTVGRAKIDAATEALLNNLGFARSRAIATGVRHQVLLDSMSGELLVLPYRPEEQSGTSGAVTNANPEVALRNSLPERVSVTRWAVTPLQAVGAAQNQEFDGSAITFYPEGNSDSARIQIEDQEGNRRGILLDGYTGLTRRLEESEIER